MHSPGSRWDFRECTVAYLGFLTAYEELLKMAHIKSLEHRRIEQALILVHLGCNCSA